MSIQANRAQIVSFLSQAKGLVAAGQYTFIPRRKNMQDLATHNLTIADVKREILGLTVADYYKGPKQDLDRSRPGDIWEFKKIINNDQFYIKLKIQNVNGITTLKCLSCHEDDYA